ncbi:HTH domain-containing protein [Helicobacter pylori]|uniref:HTH domain-containing protein n=1 Tax=Helicobacter pylori TaxID=210 RepID=UPI00257846C7|nr:HTH domain-containing protein [Helicobacter pylori]WJJ01111.1 HTH domain-containing protein [Helicobacter pylori]
MTYIELGKKVLEQAGKPLSVKEIFEKACEMRLDKECNDGKILSHSLGSQLGEHNIKEEYKQFYVARKEGKTFFYWLKSRKEELVHLQEYSNAQEEKDDAEKKQKTSFHERDLHPLLVKFLNEDSKFKLLCKTIYHESCKKSKKGKCEWNYPDIVGVYFPYDKDLKSKYEKETLKFLHHNGQKRHKLFSFELKKDLSLSNLKESYFQAVSNSSWANEGYLVVFKIEDKEKNEILDELKRLNQSFGIGVIKLESEISNSKILLPAREREIDIPTLNMLVEQSPEDFKPFMEEINTQIEKGLDTPIEMNGFDKVLNDEAMQKHIKDKGIEAE